MSTGVWGVQGRPGLVLPAQTDRLPPRRGHPTTVAVFELTQCDLLKAGGKT